MNRKIIFTFLATIFISCATTGSLKMELESMPSTPNNTRIYNELVERVKPVVVEVMQSYGIKVEEIRPRPNGMVIVGEKGGAGRNLANLAFLGAYSLVLGNYGEYVGVFIETVTKNTASVKVLSKKKVQTNVFGKDWTPDILDGISSKLRFQKDVINKEKYDIYGKDKDWLASVNSALNTALAFESKPSLGITCQGRFGEYITSRLISYIGNNSKNVELIVTSTGQLKQINEQIALHQTGLYDETTAVQAGKFIGAKYLLVCSPYIKVESTIVELHCKLVNIESAKFLGGGIIVNIPLKELPT